MALTAAERQRRHRQKLRAEGKLPQQSHVKGRGKSKNATDGRQKWVMRLQVGGRCHGQPKMADSLGGAVVQENFVANGNVETRSEDVGFDKAGVHPHNEANEQSEGNVPDAEGLPQLRNNLQQSVDVKQEPVFEMASSDAGLESTQDVGLLNPGSELNAEQDFTIPYSYHSTYVSAELVEAQEKLLRKRQGNRERQQRRRRRMREEGRYEVYKQKHVVHCEKHRATKREIEKALPESLRREFIAKRREDGRRRVAQYRARKKQIALEMQTSLAIEDSVESGLSQSFVLCPSEPTPLEPNIAAFNPGILPCTLVKCHTSTPSETPSPALSQADKSSPSGSQTTSGRTKPGQVSRSKVTYCDRHVASTSSLAPYVILPSQTVSSEEDLNTRNAAAEASQQDKPSSYPAAEVVPRYLTRPPIWPSSRSVTESLPQVGILPNSPDYGKLQGTSQITNGQNQADFNTVEPMEENLGESQTDSSQTQTQSSQPIVTSDNTLDAVSDDDRHHRVPMYDPLDEMDEEETPEVLQEDLLKIQSQFPMVHCYVKFMEELILDLDRPPTESSATNHDQLGNVTRDALTPLGLRGECTRPASHPPTPNRPKQGDCQMCPARRSGGKQTNRVCAMCHHFCCKEHSDKIASIYCRNCYTP